MGAKKSFGQHFLRDEKAIQMILEALDAPRYDLIVEVGPGTGALTTHLAKQAKRLVLLEADQDLVPRLTVDYPEARIVVGDAAKTDYAAVVGDGRWALVGNLPYNAANAILMRALQAPKPPACSVIMVQKEVGERMLGVPESMSVLSVAVGLYTRVDKVCTVKPGAFVPPPLVDSMVVRLVPHAAVANPEAVIALAKAGFAHRRKFLAKNIATAGVAPADQVAAWLQEHGFTAQARAEELTVAQWIDLHRTLFPHG